MKVKDLIKKLKDCDQEAIVIMSSDGEGNSYSPLYDIDSDSNYESGEIGFKELTKELIKEGYSEEDILDGESAVVFFPTS